MKYSAWTNKQIVRLRECWPTMTRQELIAEFDPHPWMSIKKTAFKFGIRRSGSFKDWKAICDAHVMQSGIFKARS
jgi:hypothetical protein